MRQTKPNEYMINGKILYINYLLLYYILKNNPFVGPLGRWARFLKNIFHARTYFNCYIWGHRGNEKSQASSRRPGLKKLIQKSKFRNTFASESNNTFVGVPTRYISSSSTLIL